MKVVYSIFPQFLNDTISGHLALLFCMCYNRPFATSHHMTFFFIDTMILLFSRNKKSSSKYATMLIFVSMSFQLVPLRLKEVTRICMRKGCFATQSHFNDLYTNPCIFLIFQTAWKLFLQKSEKFCPRIFILTHLTHCKNRNLSAVCDT